MKSPPCSSFSHVTWLMICWREGHIPCKKNVILSCTRPVLTLRVTMKTDVKHWRSCLLSVAFEKSNMICRLSSLLCVCWKLSLPADPVASSKVSVCSAICYLGTTATPRLTFARVGGSTYRLAVSNLRHYLYKMNFWQNTINYRSREDDMFNRHRVIYFIQKVLCQVGSLANHFLQEVYMTCLHCIN